MLDSKQDPSLMRQRRFYQYCGQMVMVLAQWLTGKEDATYEDLLNFLTQNSRLPKVAEEAPKPEEAIAAPRQKEAIEAPIRQEEEIPMEDKHIIILQNGQEKRMVPVCSLRDLLIIANERFPGRGKVILQFQGMVLDTVIILRDILQMAAKPTIEVSF
ncbi:unnamed protein product [Mytilus edulis]|uniref:Uncharacterized protein n=1 Tax=Mytilus edulis TaxID=6550 RepID=A0A8S3Q8L8_MYTED|nr:unnamed protein product [Mytilus edulis]